MKRLPFLIVLLAFVVMAITYTAIQLYKPVLTMEKNPKPTEEMIVDSNRDIENKTYQSKAMKGKRQ